MLSKLILVFLVLGLVVYSYVQYQPTIITAPQAVAQNSFFTVESSKSGQWLVYNDVSHQEVGKNLMVLAGTEDIKIIFSPGLITKLVKVTKAILPSDFVLEVQSWAPTQGRMIVALSLESIANGFNEGTLEEFIRLTKVSNNTLIAGEWEPFFKKLGKYCEENMVDKSLEEHKQLWLRVAEALKWKEETLLK